jgi:hypothetical protein
MAEIVVLINMYGIPVSWKRALGLNSPGLVLTGRKAILAT